MQDDQKVGACEAPSPDGNRPPSATLALAAGHLIDAGVHARRFDTHHAAARALGVSKTRVARLVLLTSLAPDLQAEILDLRAGRALAKLSERTVRELVAVHADWEIQRWWWSLLAQRFDPDWLVDGLPARTPFPSGRRCGPGDMALGDRPLPDLADLVSRRSIKHQVRGRREDLLAAMVDGAAAPTPSGDVVAVVARDPAKLAADFERLHGHRPSSRHPEYLRRRVAWAIQAAKQGGLPKPISGRVMELREQLPERWRDVFAGVARVHVTRVHRIERGR